MIKRYNGLVIGFMMIGITSIVNNELEVFASEVDVIEKSIEALNEITSLNGTISMLQDYKTEEIEIASGVTAEIEEVCEPFSFHAEGSMWMDLFDINMTCEKYGQMEEESMHIYSSDYIDSWYKDTIDPAMQMSMKDIISPEFFKKIGLELESGEETKDYLESEVYSVTAVCDGEIFNNILDKTFEYLSTGWSMDLDFTNASLDLEILLDADSFLPMNIKFTISEEELTKISTDDTDDMIPTYFEYKIVIDEYNTLDSIIIPEDVIEAADSYDTLNEYDEMGSFENEEMIEESYVVNEEGNYILKDYAETVEAQVSPIEGYEISEYSSENYLCFNAGVFGEGDNWHEVSFFFTEPMEEWTVEDMREMFSSQSDFLTDDAGYDVQKQDFKTINVGDFEIQYADFAYTDSIGYKQCYGLAELENGFVIEVNVYEEAYEGELMTGEEVIIKAFEAIKVVS